MYPRQEYEMTEADFEELLSACQPVAAMMIGGFAPDSPQQNANRAWASLGKKMGFDGNTVRPCSGKGQRFFTAIPSETPEAQKERKTRQAAENRALEISSLESQISGLTARLDNLRSN